MHTRFPGFQGLTSPVTELAFPLAFLFFFSCTRKTSPVIPETCSTRVDFQQCVQPIFNAHCVGCHGNNGGLSLRSGEALQNLVGIPSRCDPGMLRVRPGDPEQSLLYLKITDAPGKCGSRMPPTGSALTDQEITLIQNWIQSL